MDVFIVGTCVSKRTVKVSWSSVYQTMSVKLENTDRIDDRKMLANRNC